MEQEGNLVLLDQAAHLLHRLRRAVAIIVGDEIDLEKNTMQVNKINWIKYNGISDGMEALTKIRYKDKGAFSNLYNNENGIKVQFYEPVKSIAPGQSAVFYEGDDVIGGGIIQSNIFNF
ncbi:MAG TPA: hypothetical protein PLY81_00330 [Chitinophagaceae bacterium]|nr:hypothetical protein [Chitinophagaceae bacterium]